MKRQKLQNGQHNIEGEQIWRINAAWIQVLLESCIKQDSISWGCAVGRDKYSIVGVLQLVAGQWFSHPWCLYPSSFLSL